MLLTLFYRVNTQTHFACGVCVPPCACLWLPHTPLHPRSCWIARSPSRGRRVRRRMTSTCLSSSTRWFTQSAHYTLVVEPGDATPCFFPPRRYRRVHVYAFAALSPSEPVSGSVSRSSARARVTVCIGVWVCLHSLCGCSVAQTYELWFKQVIHELSSITSIFGTG